MLTKDEKELLFLRACRTQLKHNSDWEMPRFVPSKIRLTKNINSDTNGAGLLYADAGSVFECDSNAWGAVSISLKGGKLGVLPHEMEILEYSENPHLVANVATNTPSSGNQITALCFK